jgi:hypothetical protein
VLREAAVTPNTKRTRGCVGCVIEPRNDEFAGAETVFMVERNMCNAVMRGIVIPPGSRATSRANRSRRNLGYLGSDRRECPTRPTLQYICVRLHAFGGISMMHITEDSKQVLGQQTPHHRPRLRAAQSVSRANSADLPLPRRPIRSPKSVPDTVFPSRRAECHDTYQVLASRYAGANRSAKFGGL